MDLKEIFKDEYPPIYKGMNKLNTLFNKLKKELDIKDEYYQREEITDLYYPVKKLITQMEPWLIEEKEHPDYEKVIELYFNLLTFIKISDFYDSHYVTSIELKDRDMNLKLYCVDSSYLLSEALKRGRAAIFFSATLTPLEYHRELLGGDNNDYHIKLSSPFPKDNLCLMTMDSISTRYKDRENTYIDIVKAIEAFISAKEGNYFVFFPSYVYMKNIYDMLIDRNPKRT